MRRFWKFLPAALLGASVSLSMAANGQGPRGGDRPRGPQPPAAGNRTPEDQPRDRAGDRRDERKGSSEVESWVKTLAEKITDPHDTVRDSARAALVAVGPPALPLLRKLADGDNDAKATAAKKLIAAIDRGNARSPAPTGVRGQFPPRGGQGFGPGGFGPGGFGPGGVRNLGGDRRPETGRREDDRRQDGERRDGDRRQDGERRDGERKPAGERRPDGERKPADGPPREGAERPKPNQD
ncbi:hypothetical protein [Limnoglobus roseus]|uniref:HEAT repeat domain-containing protein n=1 Tax=Limnoglobus roseus TaxID=2598579 RepID=A0A5C1ADC5_9BACT|nr:hypothetical protein [Limnoglobus roseus]QEL17359.1 hypothetical protein PX52LOC_04343 [Limnoglobus roseus]